MHDLEENGGDLTGFDAFPLQRGLPKRNDACKISWI